MDQVFTVIFDPSEDGGYACDRPRTLGVRDPRL